MHKIFPALVDPERCGTLVSAAKEALGSFRKSEGVMRRMGVNGTDVMSDYAILKYWWMPEHLKILVDDVLPEAWRAKANEVWLLRFPKGGLLDRYQSQKTLFNCLSIPLNGGGTFEIWDKEHPEAMINSAGDGVFFSLANTHQVPKTHQEDWYLCFLFLNHIALTDSELIEVSNDV